MLWPVVAVGAPLAVALSLFSVWMNLPEFYFLTWAMVLISCPAIFILGAASQVSGLRRSAGAMKYSTFEATQNVSVAQIVALKSALVFCVNLIGSSIFLAVGLFTWRFFPPASTGRLDRFYSGLNDLFLHGGVTGVTVATVIVMAALSLTLVLLSFAGLYALNRPECASNYRIRTSRAAELVIVLYGLLAIVDLAAKWDFTPFWLVNAWTIALALVMATLVSLWRTYRSRLVPLPAFAAAALTWSAFVIALSWLCIVCARAGSGWEGFGNVHTLAFCAGLAFLPLASLAWAPMSLAALRGQ